MCTWPFSFALSGSGGCPLLARLQLSEQRVIRLKLVVQGLVRAVCIAVRLKGGNDVLQEVGALHLDSAHAASQRWGGGWASGRSTTAPSTWHPRSLCSLVKCTWKW
jgi:hypothetical protein